MTRARILIQMDSGMPWTAQVLRVRQVQQARQVPQE